MINWEATKEEFVLFEKIASRAVFSANGMGIKLPKINIIMDLNATHSNGCALDLDKLLNSDEDTFLHDIFGIRKHLNRDTGELLDCFLPRCCKI